MKYIKDFAREELKKNGNLNVTNKEFLIFLVNKVERIEEKLDKKVDWNIFVYILGGLCGAFIIILRMGGII